jgi:methyl-accepting chemotaxis protein
MSSPTPRAFERRSLAFLITSIVLGLMCAIVVVFSVGYEAVSREITRELEHAREAQLMAASAGRYLTALVNQEVGMRGYLGSGDRTLLEPLELGVQQERDARTALHKAVAELATPEPGERLLALDAAAARWHETISAPQLRAREAGPLPDLQRALHDGKRAFDLIRGEHEQLMVALDARAAGVHAAAAARIGWIRGAVAVGTLVLLVLALLANV